MQANRHRRGLILSELIAFAAILLVASALLTVLAQRTRQSAGLNQSIANLRQIGAWTGSYTADYQDHVWGFSWTRANPGVTEFTDLRGPYSSDLRAAAAQMTDILRRRSGNSQLSFLSALLPQPIYGYAVLADYAGVVLPDQTFVSPGDAYRLNFVRHAHLYTTPLWPYASSYELLPAWYQHDGAPGEPAPFLSQGPTQSNYLTGLGEPIVQRRMTEVRFPAAKILYTENAQRFLGAHDVWHLFPEARAPRLLADGSVRTRPASEANPGWRPLQRSAMLQHTTFTYNPSVEQPTPGGETNVTLSGRYRWTRGGLKGRDFDGPETNTSGW